jgi:uncharacterized protein
VNVFDFHTHIGRKEHLTSRFIDYFRSAYPPEYLELMDQLTPSLFSDFLDQEGVNRAVILSEYSPGVTGVVPVEFVSDFCRQSSILTPFAAINLNSDVDSGSQVERCVGELGCRGIKLLPSYGHFFPNDVRLYPAYETATHLGVPVMFHTGTSLFPGTRIKYADPLLIDDVAEDFPELKIVMSHGGRPFWYKEAGWMLARHRNVLIDISGIPPKQLPTVFPKLEKFSDRFLFGSDWPNVQSIAKQVSMILELPFSETTIKGILYHNAVRLLKLDL